MGPLLSIHFNIVANLLVVPIARANEDGMVGGLIPPLADLGGGGPFFSE